MSEMFAKDAQKHKRKFNRFCKKQKKSKEQKLPEARAEIEREKQSVRNHPRRGLEPRCDGKLKRF